MASSRPVSPSVPVSLEGLLGAETAVVSELSGISERLARAVVSNAPEELMAIADRHIQATDRLAELTRATSAQLVAHTAGGNQGLAAPDMVGSASQLLEALAGLAELNHRNLRLLDGAMASMRGYLGFVSGFTREGRTYRGDGHARDALQGRPSAIDRRI